MNQLYIRFRQSIKYISPISTMTSLHDEIHIYTASEDTARSFLNSRGILRSTMTCFCGTLMDCIPCPETKTTDLFVCSHPLMYSNSRFYGDVLHPCFSIISQHASEDDSPNAEDQLCSTAELNHQQAQQPQ